MKLKLATLFFCLTLSASLFSQQKSTWDKVKFEADFRFRIEQDWDSRKSDGSYRDDRTRLRYRVRTGINYSDKWYHVGLRIRTGQANKQQDPQLTLGSNEAEFNILPIGLEKAYFQGKWHSTQFWMGKNTFPFKKSNELFWSDNVYPEGVFFAKGLTGSSSNKDTLDILLGHFIMQDANNSFNNDAYFQGAQLYASLLNSRVELFPALYIFKNIPLIPDYEANNTIDYTILHLGARGVFSKKNNLALELDYYQNLETYSLSDSIPNPLRDEKMGLVIGLNYGQLKNKKDWQFKATYAMLERFAAVDFMAQNDWARWDYSSYRSPDGRLTNMEGIELVAGYMLEKNISLKMKYYLVEQIVPYGPFSENGSRLRLDLDVKF